jgi:hypothetical protein
LCDRKSSLVAELEKRLAFDILHDDVRHATIGSAIEHLRDVRMMQVRQNLALGTQSGKRIAAEPSGASDLDRDFAMELVVIEQILQLFPLVGGM